MEVVVCIFGIMLLNVLSCLLCKSFPIHSYSYHLHIASFLLIRLSIPGLLCNFLCIGIVFLLVLFASGCSLVRYLHCLADGLVASEPHGLGLAAEYRAREIDK